MALSMQTAATRMQRKLQNDGSDDTRRMLTPQSSEELDTASLTDDQMAAVQSGRDISAKGEYEGDVDALHHCNGR